MSDLLEQATRALRETSSDPNPKSGLTRARILESAEKRYSAVPKSRGFLRWAVIAVAALGTSTALAHFTQEYWPEIKKAFAPAAEQHSAVEQSKKRLAKKAQTATEQVQLQAAGAAAPEVIAPAPAQERAPNEDTVANNNAEAAPAPAQPVQKRSHSRPKVTPREQPAPKPSKPAETRPSPEAVVTAPEAAEPASTPVAVAPAKPAAESAELALFRRAQRLHLAKDPKALAAWDDYLRVAGQGALVPEAKYNRALCLIRAGRKAEAKRALAPFAAGEFGNYRRAEAKSLIDALERED